MANLIFSIIIFLSTFILIELLKVQKARSEERWEAWDTMIINLLLSFI